MRHRLKPLPDLDERLELAEEQVRRARRGLERQVEEALIPLDIQEDYTISELQGNVMLVSSDDDLHDKIGELLRSEGYPFDIPERTSEAIGMLKLRNYRMVIADCRHRRRSRLFAYIERYQPFVKTIAIVPNRNRARESMRQGSYSFLLGKDFELGQLSTCLVSSLKLRHRVCWLLAHGEPCNRSCVDSYQSDEDFGEMQER